MLKTNPIILRQVLEQLDRAAHEHAAWRDQLLRALSGQRPHDPNDVAPGAHLRCRFGQWYRQLQIAEIRELPSFAMLEVEHENQHGVAARLLTALAAGRRPGPADVEEFEEASSRLNFALYFIRREIECAMRSRDALTDAHSSTEMLRDLREWHALARQPGKHCCIAVMELDGVEEINAAHGYQAGAQAIVAAVKHVAASLRATDGVFRHEANKFLIRLSGMDLAGGYAVILRLRDDIGRKLSSVGSDGTPMRVSASFGVALLDPDVDVLESVDRADQALTLARTAGRSQIIRWDPSVTTGVRLRRVEAKDVQS